MWAEGYWPDNQKGDGPSVSDVVSEHVNKMKDTITHNVTTKTMLDVESKVTHPPLLITENIHLFIRSISLNKACIARGV